MNSSISWVFCLLFISFTKLWQTRAPFFLHLCYLISLLISNNQLPGWSEPLMPLAGNCLCARASQINQISQWWLNSVGRDPDEDKFPHLPNSCSVQLISLGEKLTNRVHVGVFTLFHRADSRPYLVFQGFVSEELRTDVWRQKWRCVCIIYIYIISWIKLELSYIEKVFISDLIFDSKHIL